MPIEDDWSESDEDNTSEVETSVLLGVPDGPIDNTADILDAAVSRIGGRPAFLPSEEPPFNSSKCKVCDSPMELLVQMWCPFENSPMDRALYVWNVDDQLSSVRAWRGLRYNEKYAAKLKQKIARKQEKEMQKAQAAAEAAQKQLAPKSNPFSLGSSPSIGNPFGLGDQIFGGAPTQPPPASSPPQSGEEENHADSDDESEASESSDQSLLTALASTTLEESPWASAPSYPPLYLSTASEYLPPPPKLKLPAGVQVEDDSSRNKGKDEPWTSEAYENSLETDHVFDRFSKRVGYEAEQCVRYELNGTPLPFTSDRIFDMLFPAPPAPVLPVTKSVFTVVPPAKRTYVSSAVPPCPHCNSPRIFECQLMPNLINTLRPHFEDQIQGAQGKMTDAERRRAVEEALKDKSGDVKRGMEWGTCLVFSCEKDCRVDAGGNKEAKDVWREEVVLVQWDT